MSGGGNELRRPQDLTRVQSAWLLAVPLALVAIARLRLLSVPLERDEGEYAYIGQLLLQGVPPYVAAYSMKLPGVPVCYAAIMSAFGQDATGIRLGLAIVNAVTCVLLYFIGRDLFGRWGGVAASAAYGVLSLGSVVHGCMANAEHFALLPAMAGVWCLVRTAGPNRKSLALAGLCFGLAVMAKQHAVVFLAFGLTWLLWNSWIARGWARLPLDVLAIGAGPVALYALLCLWIWGAGVFPSFWMWTITYPQAYVSQVAPAQAWSQFLWTGIPVLIFGLPVLGASLLGLGLALGHDPQRSGMLLVMFGVFSGLAVAVGGHFREHYFLFALPAVALSFGAVIDGLAARLSANRRLAVAGGAIGVALSWSIWCDQDVLWHLSPNEVSIRMYGENPFPESPAIGQYIRETTAPSATIAVLGSEPQIPFYARRRSATGHLYMYPLTENQPFAQSMQREMVAQIEAAAPEIVVVVRTPTSWLLRPETPSDLFDWMVPYVDRHYALDAVFDRDENGRAIVLTGKQAVDHNHVSPLAIKLLRGKE